MKSILFGYYGAGNVGDELMLVCLKQWLSEQGVPIAIGTHLPDQVRRLHGVPVVRDLPLLGQYAWVHVWVRGNGFSLLREIWRADRILLGGGDFIRDDRGWKHFSASVEKLVVGWLFGKSIYLVNVGVGKPCTWYGRLLLRWILRRCDKIIVRDRRSLQVCRELGAADRTVFTMDIVMEMQSLLGLSPQPVSEAPYILVALRGNPNVYGQYDFDEARIDCFAKALDAIVKRHHCNIVFLPFHSGSEDDNSLHKAIVSRMKYSDSVMVREWEFNIQTLLNIFRGASCVVAMRLHAAILALSVGRDCVVLPYDHKVKELCAEMELRHLLPPELLDSTESTVSVIENAMDASWSPPRSYPKWESIRLLQQEPFELSEADCMTESPVYKR